jgi:hypothetical protein
MVGVEGFVQDQQTILSGRHLACVRDRKVPFRVQGVVVNGPKLSRREKGKKSEMSWRILAS